MISTTADPTLRELRHLRGLSLDAVEVLAEEEIDAATISRTERGLTEPTPKTIVALAKAYGISAKRMRRIVTHTAEVAVLGERPQQ
jgi:transcriptional regulator with XRE-family HTH domain